MPTYRFQEVKHCVTRKLKCRTCGKRFTRQRTFTNTISPFNKSKATGLPKTYREVLANVKAEAEAWQPDDRCTACTNAKLAELEAVVEAFNEQYPSGTAVRYWRGVREGAGTESVTRGRARVLGGHAPVVWIEGEAGAIALTHVEPTSVEVSA